MRFYLVFLFFYMVVFSLIDFFTNKHYARDWPGMSAARRTELVVLLLVHNLIYPYLYFTLLFLISGTVKGRAFVAIYFLVCTGVLFHWISNDNQCVLTQMQNEVMEVEGLGFRDTLSVLTNTYTENNPSSLRSILYYAAIVTNIVYSGCYLIFKL
jgi:hypothetical protein